MLVSGRVILWRYWRWQDEKNKFGWLKKNEVFLFSKTRLFYLHRKRHVIYRTHLLMLEKSSKKPPRKRKGSIRNADEITWRFILTIGNWFFWISEPSTVPYTKLPNPPRKTSEVEPLVVDSDQKFPSYFPILSIKRVFIYLFVPHDPWQSFRRWREHLDQKFQK